MKRKLLITLSVVIVATGSWLAHRTEIELGRVLNSQGDGKLYNNEPFYNYIHYPAKCNRGDIVMTVCLLNPFNNYCDDIITRGDVILLHDTPSDMDDYPSDEMYY